MNFRNPFKHRHDIDHICYCRQIMCKCRKHLWEIIRDSKKKFDGNGNLKQFQLNDNWYSIQGIIHECKKNGLRFYCEELGEVQTMYVKK